MSEMNQNLLAVSASLNELARQIHEKKDATTNTKAYVALNNLLVDISHRIALVGGLIFAERSQRIAEAAEEVENSKEALTEAIGEIDNIKQLLDTATAFLGTVDNVIGVARQVAAGV